MRKLFSTLCRATIVAIGLSTAPAAFAQGTLNCPSGFTPLVSGNEVTCQMACTSGTPTPTITGSSLSFTCSTGGGDVAPAGCTLSASPTSGTAATDVTLTLKCTSGTLPINVAWQGSAPGNCPSGTGAMDALTKTCTVPGVSQTTTWTVSQFSNTVGNGTANKSASFTFNQGGGGGDFANCPSGSLTTASFYPTPTGSESTLGLGYLGAGKIMSIKMVIPPASSVRNKSASFSTSYGGGDATRTWAISRTACDLTTPVHSSLKGSTGTNLMLYYKAGPAGSASDVLISGQTYFLNIRGESNCQPNADNICGFSPVSFKW